MFYVVIHNISSVQRIIDITKFIYLYTKPNEVSVLVLSKVSGSAAHTGLPEVSKIAYKLERQLLITNNIDEAINILKPEKVFIITSQIKSKTSASELVEEARKTSVMLVLPGSESAFSKQDIALGKPANIKGIDEDMGVLPYVIITLYTLISKLRETIIN